VRMQCAVPHPLPEDHQEKRSPDQDTFGWGFSSRHTSRSGENTNVCHGQARVTIPVKMYAPVTGSFRCRRNAARCHSVMSPARTFKSCGRTEEAWIEPRVITETTMTKGQGSGGNQNAGRPARAAAARAPTCGRTGKSSRRRGWGDQLGTAGALPWTVTRAHPH